MVSWNERTKRKPMALHVNHALLETIEVMNGAADCVDGKHPQPTWTQARKDGWHIMGQLCNLRAAQAEGIPASHLDDIVGV